MYVVDEGGGSQGSGLREDLAKNEAFIYEADDKKMWQKSRSLMNILESGKYFP